MDEGIGGEGAKFAEIYRSVKLVSGMGVLGVGLHEAYESGMTFMSFVVWFGRRRRT